MDKYDVPIWLTNWVVEDRPARGKPTRFEANKVVAKGKNNEAVLNNPQGLKRALRVIYGRKKELKPDFIARHKAIHVEIIRQIGLGLNE